MSLQFGITHLLLNAKGCDYPAFWYRCKILGNAVMFGAIGILFALPWLDKSPVKSMRYKGRFSRFALLMFVVSFITLGYLGTQAVSPVKLFWLK